MEHQLHGLQPAQAGVGGKSPAIQAAILCVKSCLGEMAADELLLEVDIANAYNSISREACLAGVKKYCPHIGRWAHWCLIGTSRIYYDKYVVPRATGRPARRFLGAGFFPIGLDGIAEKKTRPLGGPNGRTKEFKASAVTCTPHRLGKPDVPPK